MFLRRGEVTLRAVPPLDLEAIARVCEAAADRARQEIVPRFRAVEVEWKSDGSPVTEADRAAERAIREVLHEAYPDYGVLGEEYGAEGKAEGPRFIIDPIDGTISFSRGVPLYATIIAFAVDGEPQVGLIDLPGLQERYVGWQGGGCSRNGKPVSCSRETDLRKSIVSHGDAFCFERAGEKAAFERMARELPLLRGYTDAFGHAMVLSGAVDVMIDLDLNPWDGAATRVLVPEAGGRAVALPDWKGREEKLGLLFGSPALVDQLLEFLATKPA